jgi:CHAT domain-containing protein
LNSSGSLRKIAATHSNTKEKYETLKSYQIRLASLYSLPIQERDSALVLNLESKSDQLEKELTRILSPYSEAHRQITWRDIQKKLKKNEVAIEFVHYTYYQRSDTVTTKYAAILITSATKQPKYISLFDEHQLEFSKLNNKNILTSYSSRGAIPSQGQTTPLDLYELIWKPLMPYLNKINTIYYSPSGVLHRINLDAIPMFGMTLSDQYKLIRVNSTRNLVRSDENQTKVLKDAILFGGIEYDLDSTENILARNKIVSQQKFKKKIQIESSTKDTKWNYLPGTSEEVKEIKKQLDNSNISTTLYSGIQASEENFKSIGISSPSPQILHLATHGFFFPDPKKETQTIKSINNEVIFQTSQLPMMRSGLLMAGANYAWKVGKPINSETEDGILTAYEISQMNLSNTELVILSACETGLGEIQGNEGVYGLQRAFKMAGVKYIIMSLWQVPDKQTSLLMTTFYKKWLENQLSIPNAFQAAQKELRLSGLDPVQWAGFILVE